MLKIFSLFFICSFQESIKSFGCLLEVFYSFVKVFCTKNKLWKKLLILVLSQKPIWRSPKDAL